MRKIISKKELEKRKKRNSWIVGIVLVFLMILSTLGYAFTGSESSENGERITYNGINFINQNNFWFAQIENLQFTFSYNPLQVEEQDVILNSLESYYNKPLYIVSEDSSASSEIYNNLNPFVLRMQNACLENETCEEDFPIKNCEDNLIVIRETNFTKIVQKENCVFIEGPLDEIVETTDEFLFQLLNIRQG
jgi:hypothetical protein